MKRKLERLDRMQGNRQTGGSGESSCKFGEHVRVHNGSQQVLVVSPVPDLTTIFCNLERGRALTR